MTSINYDQRSPYAKTPQVSKYVDYLDFWVAPSIPASATDLIVNVDNKYKFRPDLLSYDLYGTPQLWWVFAARNPDVLQDPIFNFVPGITIYAPQTSSIGKYV